MEILSILAISQIHYQSLSNLETPLLHRQQIEISSTQRLSDAEISQRLQTLSGWKREGQTIIYSHTFNNFIESINFINCLVEPAEKLGHHPDLTVSYNQVKISLTTHDQGGLTDLDFQLAETISQLINDFSVTSGKQCKK
ncbi:MAG: 4a-hydroxytetrahydrobiopterin dehydratase [Cyanobacteria bacterium J06592_8]